ncbi:peptidyl-prolyl cis-trans isomerase SurA [Nocardioides sp. BE266]|uniref:SurA N-terminal domain-containing protein n=1 Tax=Nocardioides sp. BE266 TaxID=2817725 RepID=UPI002856DAEA|nr:SurA N-terminal domain-containing protein [Nocardioides sp. BE266]MDR7254831.1 peptidyl-prolyl cis-trans isomerase SurA [Nocardioides sp. BE266]
MTHTIRTHRPARTTVGALAAAALLTLTACNAGGDDDSKASDDSSASADPSASSSADAAAEPDLDGIPDVVAEVNGEEVTKDEFVPIYEVAFQQATSQAQMGGQAPDEDALKKQTVDELVDTELLSQEADSRGIEVSDDDVDAELETLAKQNQMGSAEELLKAVEKQGMSEDQARSQVETQVMVEQLAADEDGSIDPTEKELRALYAQAKKQQAQSGQKGQKIPPFAQVHDQLEEQARSEQVGKVAESLLKDLRKDADITINL